jgi:hypothetical protein
MEKQQAAAIAEAVLDPHLQAQQRRSATLTAASRQRARNRDITWFGLAGLVVGTSVGWSTGTALSHGALLGVGAGCVLGCIARVFRSTRRG